MIFLVAGCLLVLIRSYSKGRYQVLLKKNKKQTKKASGERKLAGISQKSRWSICPALVMYT